MHCFMKKKKKFYKHKQTKPQRMKDQEDIEKQPLDSSRQKYKINRNILKQYIARK